jgi:hypothetical protein
MLKIAILMSTLFFSLSVSAATFTTSTGSVFTQVQDPGAFGTAWQDPSGALWSSYQGDYQNIGITPDGDDAVTETASTDACAKIGGLLPARNDFVNLLSYFDQKYGKLTQYGLMDLHTLFPFTVGRGFWSSSIFGGPGSYGIMLNAVWGDVTGGVGGGEAPLVLMSLYSEGRKYFSQVAQ